MRALKLFSFPVLSLLFMAISHLAQAHDFAHSPAPASAPAPTSDGTAVDQGVAYVLMLVALAITYMFH